MSTDRALPQAQQPPVDDLVDARLRSSIKALIAGAGMTIDDLAAGTDIRRTTLHRRLQKKGPAPFKAAEVARIATYFRHEVGDLYSGRVNVNPPGAPATSPGTLHAPDLGPSARSSTDRASDYGSEGSRFRPRRRLTIAS